MQCQSRQLSLCLSDDRPTDRLYIYTSPIPHNVDYIINLQKTLNIIGSVRKPINQYNIAVYITYSRNT